jgi:hypothetical protein
VFCTDPAILNRHLPTGERDHPRAQVTVFAIQWKLPSLLFGHAAPALSFGRNADAV